MSENSAQENAPPHPQKSAASDQAYYQIRQDIVSGTLKERERLTEQALAVLTALVLPVPVYDSHRAVLPVPVQLSAPALSVCR